MANQELIKHLNHALSVEYAAVIQYNQHSALVMGTERAVYGEFFEDASKEARSHAKKVADWIVSLDGVPTIEAASIQQSTDVREMLEQDLKTETEALEAYRAAHAAADDNTPIKFMLEEQIMLEQDDVWEIEKFLEMKKIKVSKGKSGSKAG